MAHKVHPTEQGYEATDPSVRTIVISALGVTLIAILVCIALAWFLRLLIATETPAKRNPLAPAVQVPPEPRVEVHPWEQLHGMRTQEDELLRTYGWVDKQKGIVRIPIDRAMDLTIERGLPVRKEATKK